MNGLGVMPKEMRRRRPTLSLARYEARDQRRRLDASVQVRASGDNKAFALDDTLNQDTTRPPGAALA